MTTRAPLSDYGKLSEVEAVDYELRLDRLTKLEHLLGEIAETDPGTVDLAERVYVENGVATHTGPQPIEDK